MSHQIADCLFDFIIEGKASTRPLIKQVHHNALIEVTPNTVAPLTHAPPEADGIYTTAAELSLSVYTADCIPLLFFSKLKSGPIAALHCGWRGARANIVGGLFTTLQRTYQCQPDELHVIMGPCIMSCCFEVKEDLIQSFQSENYDLKPYLEYRNRNTYFALNEFVLKEQLAPIPPDQRHLQYLKCTHCSVPQLPSYRRDKKTDPRIRSSIKRVASTLPISSKPHL